MLICVDRLVTSTLFDSCVSSVLTQEVSFLPTQVYKGKKANIDSYSAFFDNCKANDTGLTKQLEDAGVTDVYCNSPQLT